MLGGDVVAGFRAGDEASVREVYRTYGRLVYAVARRLVSTPELAEEVTQETFVKAWAAAERYDGERDLAPWLATIARRTAYDVLRREGRRVQTVAGERPELERLGDADPSAEQVAERRADAVEVRRAVDALPDDEREVVRRQHLVGQTHVQIAEELGVPVGTVKSRSHRAHRRLAASLAALRTEAPP